MRTENVITAEDEDYMRWLTDLEHWAESRLRRWEQIIEKEGGIDAYFAETSDEKIGILSGMIAEIERRYEECRAADKPYVDRAMLLIVLRYEDLKKVRGKLQASLWHKDHPGEVTDLEIEAARRVPLEKIIEVGKSKMVVCKFHDDKTPSMLVKNGFGYCFACGAWCDSIKYLMAIEKLTFFDAVQTLRAR